MAHFHLHQRRGSVLIRDLEGVDLPDAAAREEALSAARDRMSATMPDTIAVDSEVPNSFW